MEKQPTTESQETHLKEIDLRLDNMEEKVNYLNKIIVRGNGKPSLVEDVHTLVQFMTDQKDNYKFWSRWIIAGIVANIVGYTIAAFVWFIRIAPLLEKIATAYPHP